MRKIADPWSELREDVRALAPPMTPEFERQLRERLAEQRTPQPRRLGRLRSPTWMPGWLSSPWRWSTAAGLATAGALIAAVIIASPWSTGTRQAEEALPPQARSGSAFSSQNDPNSAAPAGSPRASNGATAESAPSPGGETSSPTTAVGGAAAPGRVQQRAASISLAATPSEVQAVADSVARLAVSLGGYVQSSQVQVHEEGSTSRAELALRLPSAKLSSALAALARLAPTLAESQSLQDITDTYDAARRKLSDATAERRALLRALAAASTAGEIDSLRERLAQSRSAIAQARSALAAVAQRASTAEVEVTVLGDAHAASEGLTLHRALHDAGHVLVVTLAVMLIAAAILLPLALLILALSAGCRSLRRYRRERLLDAH